MNNPHSITSQTLILDFDQAECEIVTKSKCLISIHDLHSGDHNALALHSDKRSRINTLNEFIEVLSGNVSMDGMNSMGSKNEKESTKETKRSSNLKNQINLMQRADRFINAKHENQLKGGFYSKTRRANLQRLQVTYEVEATAESSPLVRKSQSSDKKFERQFSFYSPKKESQTFRQKSYTANSLKHSIIKPQLTHINLAPRSSIGGASAKRLMSSLTDYYNEKKYLSPSSKKEYEHLKKAATVIRQASSDARAKVTNEETQQQQYLDVKIVPADGNNQKIHTSSSPKIAPSKVSSPPPSDKKALISAVTITVSKENSPSKETQKPADAVGKRNKSKAKNPPIAAEFTLTLEKVTKPTALQAAKQKKNDSAEINIVCQRLRGQANVGGDNNGQQTQNLKSAIQDLKDYMTNLANFLQKN